MTGARNSCMRPYLELFRVSNIPTVLTNVATAWLLSAAVPVWQRSQSSRGLAAGLAVVCLYFAGMGLNDVLDVEQDRARRADRPVPSGRLSLAKAWAATVGAFAAAMGLLATLGLQPFAAGAALMALIVGYDVSHKRWAASVWLMGLCRGMVYVVLGAALASQLTVPLLVAAVGQTLYVVGITVAARWEKTGRIRWRVPMPWLIAGIALVDGLLAAVFVRPGWILLGLAGMGLTVYGQRMVRGD